MALVHMLSSNLEFRGSDCRGVGCGRRSLVEAVGWVDGMEDGLSYAVVLGDGGC